MQLEADRCLRVRRASTSRRWTTTGTARTHRRRPATASSTTSWSTPDDRRPGVGHLGHRAAYQRDLVPQLPRPVRAHRVDQPGDRRRRRRHQLLDRLAGPVRDLGRLRHRGLLERPRGRHLRRHLQRQRRARPGHDRGHRPTRRGSRRWVRPPTPATNGTARDRPHQQRRRALRHPRQVGDRPCAHSDPDRLRRRRSATPSATTPRATTPTSRRQDRRLRSRQGERPRRRSRRTSRHKVLSGSC